MHDPGAGPPEVAPGHSASRRHTQGLAGAPVGCPPTHYRHHTTELESLCKCLDNVMVYDPQSGGTGGLHASPSLCVAPKHTTPPRQLPSGGLGPFPARVGVRGRGQPLPHVVTQTASPRASPGLRGVGFRTTAFLGPHGNRAAPPFPGKPSPQRHGCHSNAYGFSQPHCPANSEGQLGVQDRGARCCPGVGPVLGRRSQPSQGPRWGVSGQRAPAFS